MNSPYFHPTALVESESIGAGTRVWAFAHVMQGAQIGRDCNLGDHVFVEEGATIGDNVTLKNLVCVWKGVTLEDDVFVGPAAVFTNDLHPRSPRMPAAARRYSRTENWLTPTKVHQGATIGAGATILAGVCLGRYSLIAAGATVTRDVQPFTLVAGSPARPAGYVCRCGLRLESMPPVEACRECHTKPDFFERSLQSKSN